MLSTITARGRRWTGWLSEQLAPSPSPGATERAEPLERSRGQRLRWLSCGTLILLALLLLFFVVTRGRLGGPLASATLARGATEDFQPIEPTTTFTATDEIHLIVRMRNLPPATPVRVVWIAVEAEGVEPETTAAEFTQSLSGSQRAEFTLRNDGPWPAGRYRADIYVEESLVRSVEFEIGE